MSEHPGRRKRHPAVFTRITAFFFRCQEKPSKTLMIFVFSGMTAILTGLFITGYAAAFMLMGSILFCFIVPDLPASSGLPGKVTPQEDLVVHYNDPGKLTHPAVSRPFYRHFIHWHSQILYNSGHLLCLSGIPDLPAQKNLKITENQL